MAEWRVEAWQSDFRVCACDINKEKSSGAVVKKKQKQMGLQKWERYKDESRNTKGTRKYFQPPFPPFLLPLEKAFVVVGCRTLITYNNLLVPAGDGEKGQVGITFVLKRMMMIERRMAMVMTIIFLKCFHHILPRIFLVFWDSLA